MLSFAAITLAATQYVGKPIQCWVPPEFTGAWEKYAETYCFVKGTYFLPMDDLHIDDSYAARENIFIGYYQWVPLVLAAQALFFYLPSFLWKAFNFNTGINVKSVLNSAALVKKKFDKNTRNAQVDKAATHILEALEMQRELKTCKELKNKLLNKFEINILVSSLNNSGFRFIHKILLLSSLGKRAGVFLTVLYLFTKFLYVANILLQFLILNAFLGPQYTYWGFGILKDIWNGREWSESGHFPRVTMCDFNVRVLGNIHRWTVQCVLMINMFNEKVFVFFWFWFLFVGVLSLLGLFYWSTATILPGCKRAFITKYLRCMGVIEQTSNAFEIHLTNGGDLLVGEIITSLFERYKSKVE
ncbi:unnamed protein product [Meloidogyne enterolobii]|uniref:Uncharacterized protein n=1 Tax=Meloidogyne enterolobii TaxID=390850 RepID=A0ACB0ZWL2_MELEN